MLKKNNRLLKRTDFLEVKNKGQIFWGRYFGVSFLQKEDFRLGFVVTKKTMNKAVDRNRFRRLFSEVVAHNLPREKGWFVVIAKKEALEKSFLDIKNEISSFAIFKNI